MCRLPERRAHGGTCVHYRSFKQSLQRVYSRGFFLHVVLDIGPWLAPMHHGLPEMLFRVGFATLFACDSFCGRCGKLDLRPLWKSTALMVIFRVSRSMDACLIWKYGCLNVMLDYWHNPIVYPLFIQIRQKLLQIVLPIDQKIWTILSHCPL